MADVAEVAARISDAVMTADVVGLTTAMCSVDSTTGTEPLMMAAVAEAFRLDGWHVQTQQVGDIPGRVNVYATPTDGPIDVLLTTHLDTVPPYMPPVVKAGRIEGRGTCDAKGVGAAMWLAARAVASSGESRVGMLFVVGEETTSDGAKAAATWLPKTRYVIDGEPTEMKVISAMKGVLIFDLKADGKTAHSAYPHLGHSAVHQLLGDLRALDDAAWPIDGELGPTTLNVGTIEGGVARNVLAPSAKAGVVMRTTADADALEAKMRALLHDDTKVDVLSKNSPQRLVTVEGEETGVVAFGSDVPYLSALGLPLLAGPGSIHDAHTAHEYVNIADLEDAVCLYVRLVQRLLSGEGVVHPD